MMENYDFLIVGAGLTGAIFAHEATACGKKCLVIDRRNHIAGNCYTECVRGINVHKYGAHIFHTSDEGIWNYVQQFAKFNSFVNSPVANYHGELYNLPFNMNTFKQMWGVQDADEARAIIDKQRKESLGALNGEPKNLEEQALSFVGRDIFEKLVKEYTEKQWGRSCKDLPAFIIKRLPVRFEFDNNYFNDIYQGIPKGGYTRMVERMLDGVDVLLNSSYKDFCVKHPQARKIRTVYTGPIDEFFDFVFGPLEYRSLLFETELLEGVDDWQGNAVVNYTSHDEPFTRIIEHKHFEFGLDSSGKRLPDTVISREYPTEWKLGDEPYYPVNDEKNSELYNKYLELAKKQDNVVFAGRLGAYKYYDMAPCIAAALQLAERELGA